MTTYTYAHYLLIIPIKIGHRISSATLTSDGFDVARPVFLEQQFQGVNVVEFHPRNTTDESFIHSFVLPYVHVLYVVELRVRRCFHVEMKLSGLVIVNLETDIGT